LRPAAHVNLIPLNPTPGYPTKGSSLKRVHEFRDLLEQLGANATVRQNRGTDIDAACGQLAAGQPVTLERKAALDSAAPRPTRPAETHPANTVVE
jgi:23S rRNA (adenine2503-C2)-methyltransferase